MIKKLWVITIVISSLLSAKGGETFAVENLHVFSDMNHSKVVGLLEIGASVSPVKKQDKWYEITIKGWQQEGISSKIFAFKGKRIVKVTLTPEGVKHLKVLKTIKDPETELTWHMVELTGVWVNGEGLNPSIHKRWQEAHALYEERCSMCHALPHTTKYTANQWPSTLRVMSKRSALTQDETELISKYLQYHAKDIVGNRKMYKVNHGMKNDRH